MERGLGPPNHAAHARAWWRLSLQPQPQRGTGQGLRPALDGPHRPRWPRPLRGHPRPRLSRAAAGAHRCPGGDPVQRHGIRCAGRRARLADHRARPAGTRAAGHRRAGLQPQRATARQPR
ncbi:hypothetical protein G6F32_015801 [Rhizopus arrhizus]|nr:hypothetical protein G6F32_015801 [Rhizopus arrhizus]